MAGPAGNLFPVALHGLYVNSPKLKPDDGTAGNSRFGKIGRKLILPILVELDISLTATGRWQDCRAFSSRDGKFLPPWFSNLFYAGSSRMSDYRVVWPDEALDCGSVGLADEEPVILQFCVSEAMPLSGKMDVITRARLLFDNRSCPTCSYPVVTPIELNDAQFNRNHLPIPGTATLVGFRCSGCRAEWSV